MAYGGEEEERKKLMEIATGSVLAEVRKRAIDALAAYGPVAIPEILKVVESSVTEEVKTYGLEKVKELRGEV